MKIASSVPDTSGSSRAPGSPTSATTSPAATSTPRRSSGSAEARCRSTSRAWTSWSTATRRGAAHVHHRRARRRRRRGGGLPRGRHAARPRRLRAICRTSSRPPTGRRRADRLRGDRHEEHGAGRHRRQGRSDRRRRSRSTQFAVASNPEFLKEGDAVNDFMQARPRVIVGADDPRAIDMLRELYAPFMRTSDRIQVMDIALGRADEVRRRTRCSRRASRS